MQTQITSVLAAAWLSLAVVMASVCSSTAEAAPRKPSALPAPATTHVFRCGNQYQPTPCNTLDANSRIVPVSDSRTADQIRAAFVAQKKGQRDMRALDKAVSKGVKAKSAKPKLAIGLSCHVPGSRPFERCANTPRGARTTPRRPDKPTKPERYLAMSPEAS